MALRASFAEITLLALLGSNGVATAAELGVGFPMKNVRFFRGRQLRRHYDSSLGCTALGRRKVL